MLRHAALLAAGLLSACATDAGRVPAPPPPPLATPRPATPLPPEWRPVPAVADAPLRSARTVAAAPGEGLAAVARREGAPLSVLAAANRIAPPYTLVAGQTLVVPGGRYHRVRRGETLSAIARAYRTDLATVAQANLLQPPYTLEIGDVVLVPVRPQLTLEERARANRLNIDRLIDGLPSESLPRPRPATPVSGSRADAPKPRPSETAAPPRPVPAPAVPVLADAPRFDWPLDGRIVSAFGRKPGGRVNDGVNIAAVAGAPVKAAADGHVIYAGTGVPAFGGLLLLRHADGWITAYGHNESVIVARGDAVTRGQTIARAGATGEVDSPQLHFEIRRGRTPVNPLPLLPGRPAA